MLSATMMMQFKPLSLSGVGNVNALCAHINKPITFS